MTAARAVFVAGQLVWVCGIGKVWPGLLLPGEGVGVLLLELPNPGVGVLLVPELPGREEQAVRRMSRKQGRAPKRIGAR